MLAYLFRYDVIKRLSHGYCPIGPMGNAMRAVPSHPIPWDISHGIPMGIPFPWTSLNIIESSNHAIIKGVFYAAHTLQLAVNDAEANSIKLKHCKALSICKTLGNPSIMVIKKKLKRRKPILNCVTSWHCTCNMLQ